MIDPSGQCPQHSLQHPLRYLTQLPNTAESHNALVHLPPQILVH